MTSLKWWERPRLAHIERRGELWALRIAAPFDVAHVSDVAHVIPWERIPPGFVVYAGSPDVLCTIAGVLLEAAGHIEEMSNADA